MEGSDIARAAAFFGAAFAMAIGSLGPAIGQGMIGKQACDAIGKYPESANNIRLSMMMGMAFVESSSVYNLIIAVMLIMFAR